MADRSDISWCDGTPQVASGCTPKSEGCRHCYSAGLAGTRLKHHPRTAGLTTKATDGRIVFNGSVRFHSEEVVKILKWRAPKGLGRRPRCRRLVVSRHRRYRARLVHHRHGRGAQVVPLGRVPSCGWPRMTAPTCPHCGAAIEHWRDRLPERRESATWDFDHDFGSAVVSFRATASWHPDGRLGEIFVNGSKLSSATDVMICDAAIAASLAIQHGCSLPALAKSLKRHPDGRPMGPLGAVVDEIMGTPNG